MPSSPIDPQLTIDSCICVHGTGGSFYSSTLFESVTKRLASLGVPVLQVNTRGHDLMTTLATSPGSRRQGAAYELVDDCRHDILAWTSWLVNQGRQRIVLIGHSLGAIKCIYALAYEPNPSICRLVAVSPPRLSHSHFLSGPRRDDFRRTFDTAQQHVQAGNPTALMKVKFPLPMIITASGYVEKYGPEERYNILRFLKLLRCPALVTLGGMEMEQNVAFHGLATAIEQLSTLSGSISVNVVSSADHFYTGLHDELIRDVRAWLTGTL